jgi:hypothetical protein
MAERQKTPRRRTLKSGTIILGGKAVLPCTVRNLTESGTSLEVSATFEIPSTFRFGLPGQTTRACKVIWRTVRAAGDTFPIRAPKYRPPGRWSRRVRLCGRCPVLGATVTASTSIRRCDCRAAYGSRSIASSGAPATLARGKLRKNRPAKQNNDRASVGGKGEAPHTTLAPPNSPLS